MYRSALCFAMTSALLALVVSTSSAEKPACQAASGQCLAHCASGVCKSTHVAQVAVEAPERAPAETAQDVATVDCKDAADFPCAAGNPDSGDTACACGTSLPCAGGNDVCGADGPSVAGTFAFDVSSCQCGSDCQCAATTLHDVSARLAALHWRLVEEITKNAALEARLQARAEVERLQDEFAERMLNKETEIAQLNAQLQVASERKQMSQKLVGVMAENARLKSSIDLTHDRFDLLKHKLSEKRSQQTEKLAAALATSKDHNAKLMEQISTLEKQLETLRVRLATTPGLEEVK